MLGPTVGLPTSLWPVIDPSMSKSPKAACPKATYLSTPRGGLDGGSPVQHAQSDSRVLVAHNGGGKLWPARNALQRCLQGKELLMGAWLSGSHPDLQLLTVSIDDD